MTRTLALSLCAFSAFAQQPYTTWRDYGGSADAARCIARGFRLVTLMNDSGMMASFAKTCIAETRKGAKGIA